MGKKKAVGKIGEYLRQLSVVVLGIVVTFVGSDQISSCQERREVATAMQLLKNELQENKEVLIKMQRLILFERHATTYLMAHKDCLESIPIDTLKQYGKVPFWWNTYRLSYDAWETIKSSGLMQKLPSLEFAEQLTKVYGLLEQSQEVFVFYGQTKEKLQEKLLTNPNINAFMVGQHEPLVLWRFLLSQTEGLRLVSQIPRIVGDVSPFSHSIEQIDRTLDEIASTGR